MKTETNFKVPEGRHPRGTTLREALRGNLPLRGFSGVSAGVSSRGLAGSPRGLCGGPGDFPRVVTLSLTSPGELLKLINSNTIKKSKCNWSVIGGVLSLGGFGGRGSWTETEHWSHYAHAMNYTLQSISKFLKE